MHRLRKNLVAGTSLALVLGGHAVRVQSRTPPPLGFEATSPAPNISLRPWRSEEMCTLNMRLVSYTAIQARSRMFQRRPLGSEKPPTRDMPLRKLGWAACMRWAGAWSSDPAQAAAWFRKAADQGDVTGESGLATCYARGLGVAQDDEKAFIWFKKAAEQRFLAAQLNVGLMYQSGPGVAQDQVQALKWFDLAAGHILPDSVQGAALASTARDSLSAHMTPEQVETANLLAASWLASHPIRGP